MKACVLFRKRKWLGFGGALVVLFLSSAPAQYKISSTLFKHPQFSPSELFSVDSDSLQKDTSGVVLTGVNRKSTTTAVLLSAFLPGAGQIYTGRYWKVPLILGFGGYFVSQWLRMDDHYKDSRAKYSASVIAGVNGGQGDPQLIYERDFYRDERDRFAFYIALTYLLNLVDAYVGASLYDFDVEDNLGGGVSVKIAIPIR
jgi:hypothetical protein